MTIDDDIRRLAEQQHAVLARRQARALGATASALRHRIAGPDWDAPTPRVLRLVGAPQTDLQRLMVATLDTDAVISHSSAAHLWELPGFSLGAIEVSRAQSQRHVSSQVAILHRPQRLPAEHVTERRGIPVTTLSRTLFDVAGTVHPRRLERLVDTVIARSNSTLYALHLVYDDLGRRGRDGIAVMGALLANRPVGYRPPESGLEARFMKILADAGEPPLERQVDLGGHDWIGRVDFLDRALRIIFEIDSDAFHKSETDKAADRRRDKALKAAGYHDVVRIDENLVWYQPGATLWTVQDARRRRREELRGEASPNPVPDRTPWCEFRY